MKNLSLFVFCAWLACPELSAQTIPDCSKNLPPAQNAICIAQDYQKLKDKPELVKAANDLIKKGDRLFKNKKYQEAYKAYTLSHDNLPMPYAYLRAGESMFMDYATATDFDDENGKPTGRCLSPKKLSTVVESTLWNEIDVGIELVAIVKGGPLVTTAMTLSSKASSQCMKVMISQQSLGARGCVNLHKLTKCIISGKKY